jgi:hypothetical protein
MKNTEKAFHWIIDILQKQEIVYKISGGFAATIHGSTRALADIDIEMSDADIRRLEPFVKAYITYGPEQYRDADWDLLLMTLQYEGQVIDMASTNAKIFNKETGEWERLCADLTRIEIKEVYGKQVPVETKEGLIAYKKKLGRDVDIEDVRQLTDL